MLVPTIAVPLSLLLHFVGLHRLIGHGQSAPLIRASPLEEAQAEPYVTCSGAVAKW
jgi:hypothetical protein